MHKINKGSVGVLVVSRADFVPAFEQVVSKAVVAQVFDDQPVPFALNADGSVKLTVYQNWLEQVGQDALQAFADHSDIVSPNVRGAVARPAKMRACS